MRPGRLWIVHGVILTVVLGSAWDIISGREHWPFSPYTMFSEVRSGGEISSLRLIGTIADSDRELALVDADSLAPFDQARVLFAFARMAGQPHSELALRRALSDILQRYEARRLRGDHRGPPLDGIALYELRWTLEPHAQNAEHPFSRRLIARAGEASR